MPLNRGLEKKFPYFGQFFGYFSRHWLQLTVKSKGLFGVKIQNLLQIYMLPSIKSRSQQLKFYEFQQSQQILGQSICSPAIPLKLLTKHSSDCKPQPIYNKKGSLLNSDLPITEKYSATALNSIRYANIIHEMMHRSTLSEEIKVIERKIRRCERKLKKDKQRSLCDQETQISGQESQNIDVNRFDFLTNPGGKQGEEEIQEKADELVEIRPVKTLPEQQINIINSSVEKLQKHYAMDLRKKFERREMMPHKACKRKIPKLYITHQTNSLKKVGKPLDKQQHLFRIATKEITPQEIYPTIPNFPVVRDIISKNVIAYLGDYKPFLQKTQQELPILRKLAQEKQQKAKSVTKICRYSEQNNA